MWAQKLLKHEALIAAGVINPQTPLR